MRGSTYATASLEARGSQLGTWVNAICVTYETASCETGQTTVVYNYGDGSNNHHYDDATDAVATLPDQQYDAAAQRQEYQLAARRSDAESSSIADGYDAAMARHVYQLASNRPSVKPLEHVDGMHDTIDLDSQHLV